MNEQSSRTTDNMSLMDLPLELLQNIVSIAFDSGSYTPLLRLREVNKYLDYEVTKQFMRRRIGTIRSHERDKIPATFKERLILSYLDDRTTQDDKFVKLMQLVADDMASLIQQFPTLDTAHLQSRADIFEAISTAIVKFGYEKKIMTEKDEEELPGRCLRRRESSGRPCLRHTCSAAGCKKKFCRHKRRPYFKHQGVTERDIRRTSCMIGVILDWPDYVAALLKTESLKYTEWGSLCFGRPLATAIRLCCTKVMPLFLERGMRIAYANQYSTSVLIDAAAKGNINVFFALMPFATRKPYWDLPWGEIMHAALLEEQGRLIMLLLDRGLVHRHGTSFYDVLEETVLLKGTKALQAVFSEAEMKPILLPMAGEPLGGPY
ncbi:unnamed protein product [Periconia digitata]|uniref:Uncharacterized protein n=1 Tax=Periconia digitata TaxID=1303443 RepID=A0A9W4XMG7_9PLEO|nr:unnamed protein product [Periconia digitata]